MIDIVEELKAEASYHYTDLFQRAADEIMMLRKSLHDIAAVTFCPKCHSKKELTVGWMGDIGGNPYGPFDR